MLIYSNYLIFATLKVILITKHYKYIIGSLFFKKINPFYGNYHGQLVIFLEPVHIDSESAKKGMDMRDYAHSFRINGFYLNILRKAAEALKP